MRPIINKIVETIAGLFSSTWRADRWELCEEPPLDYAFQLADCTLRDIADKMERALYPAIAILRNSPSPEEKRKRFHAVPPIIRRQIVAFMVGYIFFVQATALMLPDVARFQLLAVVVPSLLMALAIGSHRQSLTPSPAGESVIAWESISPEIRIQELKRYKDQLFLGDFDPSKFALRSGTVALSVMLMFFALGYVVLRCSVGDALPSGVTILGIVWCLTMGLTLLALFLCIIKSSRIAANAFQDEIDALTTPTSA